jgi:hypothetical protein
MVKMFQSSNRNCESWAVQSKAVIAKAEVFDEMACYSSSYVYIFR